MKKILLISLIILIVFTFSEVKAGVGDNVSGWAWSANIGWISFNSTNCDSNGDGITDTDNYSQCPVGEPITNYGVNIDSDGLFSGYAWAENIGWISFNSTDLVGCPIILCEARVNLAGEVSGWARALSSLTDGGGWDGWIKMRGTATDGSPYGVYINQTTGEFHDWAWGGDGVDEEAVIGWISFNSTNCDTDNNGFIDVVCGGDNSTTAVIDYGSITTFSFNQPPSVINLSVAQGDYCGAPHPPIHLSWEFSDDPGDSQSAYQVQANNNSDFSSPENDSGKVISGFPEYAPINLSYNTTYYWRVKVWDQNDAESDWANGSFDTSSRPPWPDFTWSPESPAAEETIEFTDQTTFYGIEPSWAWDFDEDGITDSTERSPTYSYSIAGDYTVTLTATDSGGSCSSDPKTLTATLPLPEWKEIAPFIWLKKLLASITNFFNL